MVTSALAVVSSLSIVHRLPTELIIMGAQFLCPRDLHMLTCVSHSMAKITCSLYFQKLNLVPQKSPYSVTVAGEAFSALSVWRRSPCFAPRPILSCIFDGTKALVHAQINYLRTMISSLPSKSTFDEIHLWGETSPEMLWDLLEVIDRAGFRTVDIDSWRIDHISQGAGACSKSVQLVALENLSLNYSFLSALAWASILSRLFVPNLRKLDIAGHVSWSSLTEFLQRHSGIQKVHLRIPSGIPLHARHPTHHHMLSLPALEAITGSWSHVLSLLRLLPSHPHLRSLCIEPVTDL